MRDIALPSPAKLNLFLKVLNKRKDGYHNLVTLFERIDLCDEIRCTLNRTGAIKISCDDPDVPCGFKNLAFQAAKILRETYALQNGVHIRIKKKIPVAAGLGGGSSNAATTLKCLNQIWKLDLKTEGLVKIARSLGADVPFFLYNCSYALGTQRGDHIQPLSIRRSLWHVLIVPKMKVYSREVFKAFQMASDVSNSHKQPQTNMLTKRNDNANILLHALQKRDLLGLKKGLFNDLERVVLAQYRNLYLLKGKLVNGGSLGTLLSGSGPAVFSIVKSQFAAETLKDRLSKTYQRVFIVRTKVKEEDSYGNY